MTDYGRGHGSDPWYPDDPLYGDQTWSDGQQGAGAPPAQPGTWDQYGGQLEGQYPQQPYPQQYDTYQQAQEPHQGGYFPQQHGQHGQQGWDTTGQYYPEHDYGQQQPPGPYSAEGYHDPYAAQTAYPTQQQAQQLQQAQQPQQQETQQAPRPQAQGQPTGETVVGQAAASHQAAERTADPDTGWDPGPDQGEADFFSRDDDEDEEPGEAPRRAGRRGDKQKKRRGGCGCAVAAVFFVGALGGVAYLGYDFYQDRFGPAADFAGEGTGEIEVEIPPGASLSTMGNILKEAGVVASHDAFVAEAEANGGGAIQPGYYTLREEMSAAAAVELLLDPAAISALTVPEGLRATQVYALIDEQLGLEEGATEEIAADADLGLPEWAEGDPEGFLWPARYSVGSETTPEGLLTEMVDRAEAEFTELQLDDRAAQLDRSPREILVIASLIQAEAQLDEEFGKVSRVIYNRLDIDMRLQFDSTINYAMGRFTLNTTIEDTQFDSPYNTYVEYGLPPGPIDNPGEQALEAALNPTEGDWLYFVTVTEGDTRFTRDHEEHEQNVLDYNEAQRQEGED